MIRLYELRTERGLSQRELAKQMHISQATYNNWENEKTQPSIEQLLALANFFNITVDYLIGKADDELTLTTGNDFLRSFLALNDEDRSLIKALVKKLSEK